jgi:DNA-binding CsgD family transcriptional regulator
VAGAAGSEPDALHARAREDIAAGRWAQARDALEAVVERDRSGAALFELGIASWWLGETRASLRHWERAYAAFRRRADPERAVLAAFYLCLAYRMSLGNHAASQGWLGRAASLVDEHGLDAMTGWVLIARAYVATDSGHPRAGTGYAAAARTAARERGDTDLELCALGELGAAMVELGRLEEGAALLDEAMAGALGGEGTDLDTIVLISCRTITSCSRGGDLARVTQWIRAADDFHRRYGSPHLYTTCRIRYGGILIATGDWQRAEQELLSALRIGEAAEPALHAEALATLAELRVAQGRTEEAAGLLAGYEELPAASHALATISLARREPATAAAILRRRLAELEEASLDGAAVLELLAESELQQGAVERGMRLAERLAELGASMACELVTARGARALGRAVAAAGPPERAVPHLERALAAFRRLQLPLEAGRTRALLARVLAPGEPEAAIAEARAALALFEGLGAARDADAAAALLRSLGATAARLAPRGSGVLTKRELEVLRLLGLGLSNPEIAERLFISRKTVEHHVASVLSKLGLRGRSEAAAYAVRNLGAERTSAVK